MTEPWAAVSDRLRDHYRATFVAHGATAPGVDWRDEETAAIRYDRMLAVVREPAQPFSLLDVGCGWGGLLEHAEQRGLAVTYTGIDLVAEMIDHARHEHPDATFEVLDAFDVGSLPRHDYVVCNGILTQKLDTSWVAMDAFARALITRMFDACTIGLAFNVMTTKVNYTVPNLFYKDPSEMLAFCSSLTNRFVLDHAYPMYEYTVRLFRD